MEITDREVVELVLRQFGPLSDYGIYHAAKAIGLKLTPSSARTRRNELVRDGYVFDTGRRELSDTGYSARIWTLN